MGIRGSGRHAAAVTAAVVAVLLLSGCTGTPSPRSPGSPAEPPTSAASAPATAASPASTALATAPGSDISPHAVGTVLPFECANPIAAGPTPAGLAGPTAIGVPGVMAISTSAVGANTIQWDGGVVYQGLQFAKVGLVLKAGTAFTLSVPADMRGGMKIGWSNSGYTLADTLTIPGCTTQQADAGWLVYPGGFWLKAPGCVPLTVRHGQSTATIHIPIGKPCPS